MINIYTDGACSGNPGIGGWGVVILDNNKEILLNGGVMENGMPFPGLNKLRKIREKMIFTRVVRRFLH